MRPTDLKALIVARFKAGVKRPLHVESSPGVGKTQIAAQCARELGVGFMAIHAPLLQPEDYGFPVITKERDNVQFVVSRDKFPIKGADVPERGIFLIDELSQADNSAQKILANLLQEREIHGHKLLPGWVIVSTGNRTTDRAGANRLLSHLGNRIKRVPLEASLDDWCDWAIDSGINPEIVSFIRWRPALLNAFDPQQEINPTPRAWAEGVNPDLGNIPEHLEHASFTGDVGEGAAAEFKAFLKIYRSLPSIESVLADPKGTKVPTDVAVLYALCGALGARADRDNFDKCMTYVRRMPPEFSVLFVRDSLKRNKELAQTKALIDWAASDGAKLLIS